MRNILLALILAILLISPSLAVVSDVSLISPVNYYNTTSTTPIFSFNATSNSSATLNCSLYLNDTSYANNDSVANVTDTNLTASTISTDGLYEWYITCTDDENSTNSTTRTIRIDSTAPVVTPTAVDDEGNTYSFGSWTNSSYVNVTLTCSDAGIGCDTILYNAGAAIYAPNETYSTPVHISLEGLSYIRYLANDTLNNTASAEYQSIRIDTINPEVSWVTTGGTYTVLDVMVAYNDTNNETCRLIWDGTEGDFTNYNSTHYWSSKTLSGGRSYTAQAYCNDSASRTNYTDNITLVGQAGSSPGITGSVGGSGVPTYKVMVSMKPVKQFIQIYEADGDLVKSGYYTNGEAIWLERGTYKFVFATDGKSVESTIKVDRDFTITNEMSTELYQTPATEGFNWIHLLIVAVVIAFILYKKDTFQLK